MLRLHLTKDRTGVGARTRSAWALACTTVLTFASLTSSSFATEDAQPAEGRVARAVFATEIRDREPVDPTSTIPTDQSRVFFFTELIGLQGQTIRHRWEYKGETMAEVEFHVRGPRWRVYSSKNLLPIWSGDWTVRILDESGNELGQTQLAYVGPTEREDSESESVPAAPED